jgi:uncharacterized protein (TIGR01777 family)
VKVFVTGAAGLIGAALCRALAARGDAVVAVVRGGIPRPAGARTPPGAATVLAALPGVEVVDGDILIPGPWSVALSGCDAVVHLAGESIGGKRWSRAWKERILRSRVDGTRRVVAGIETCPADRRPRALVVASGADYYPFDDSERAYAEDAAPGDTFLAQLCVAWQKEAEAVRARGVRVACLRTGVVIGRGAEALARMAMPFRLFAGGPVAGGRQWFSWVHLADVVAAYLHAVDVPAAAGPLNVVAPGALRQADFARALGAVLKRPSWAPVPAPALRLAVGELATYLAHGRKVVPAALEAQGFRFRYPDARAALAASF